MIDTELARVHVTGAELVICLADTDIQRAYACDILVFAVCCANTLAASSLQTARHGTARHGTLLLWSVEVRVTSVSCLFGV